MPGTAALARRAGSSGPWRIGWARPVATSMATAVNGTTRSSKLRSAAAEELLDHGGEAGAREQVSLGLLQRPHLGEQPSGEDLRSGHSRPHVRQSVGARRRVEGEGGAVEGADGGAGDEVGHDVVL